MRGYTYHGSTHITATALNIDKDGGMFCGKLCKKNVSYNTAVEVISCLHSTLRLKIGNF